MRHIQAVLARNTPDTLARTRCGPTRRAVALACAGLIAGCDASAARPDAAVPDKVGDAIEDGGAGRPAEPEPPLRDGQLDTSGGAWRIIEAPNNGGQLVRTPDGWLALTSRTFGGKLQTAAESILYRSSDGVTWDAIPLEGERLELQSLAYGNGRYVMFGRHEGTPVVWSSSDATTWTEAPQPLDSAQALGSVTFVGGRFFAFGFGVLGVSDDGSDWQLVQMDVVQAFGIAHGNGRFVVVGSGPVITSEDGLHWQSQSVDCSLPDVCITDPSGGVHPAILSPVMFAEDAFFAGRLSSPDGSTWSVASAAAPSTYLSGQFLRLERYQLSAWTLGGEPQPVPLVRPAQAAVTAQGRAFERIGALDDNAPYPSRVEVGFDDGLDCKTASCVMVDNQLLLVPPPGTPPLPDRVPRSASGEPLLSDACPVSSMVFCDDYDARTGCVCHPDAPREPASCTDVSQYTCEGRFTPTADEWHVPEIAQAGCSCSAVDPNQPATFAQPCTPDQPTCQAPLTCLPIDAPNSGEPPAPQPMICTSACTGDADCPTWNATGFCAGPVALRCSQGSCQPRTCE